MSSLFLLPVQILRTEKIPITKGLLLANMEKKRGVRSFVYSDSQTLGIRMITLTMGWEMGKTAVDKNCLISARCLSHFLWKLPLPLHVTMVATGASRAKLHTVQLIGLGVSTWPRLNQSKSSPPVILALREKSCHSADGCISTVWRKSVCRENVANSRGIGNPHGLQVLLPGISEILLHSINYLETSTILKLSLFKLIWSQVHHPQEDL